MSNMVLLGLLQVSKSIRSLELTPTMVAPVVLALIPLSHTQCSVILCMGPFTAYYQELSMPHSLMSPKQFCCCGMILKLAETQVGQVDLS